MNEKKKILLIEDDITMRENTAEILGLGNYDVTTAANGIEGVDFAKKGSFDLIICDIMMPKLDGLGVLHVLSNDRKTASIPFIFLTAKAEKADIRLGMESGADDYLVKPFDDTELLKAVSTRIKKHQNLAKHSQHANIDFDQFIQSILKNDHSVDIKIDYSTKTYKSKQDIFLDGDQIQHLYYLKKGRVKVYKTNHEGKEFITSVLKDGEFLNINMLIQEDQFTSSASAVEASDIVKISKNDFMNLLQSNREITLQFIKILSQNVEEKENQLLSFAYDSVRKKTAETILKLAKKLGHEQKENIKIKITRDDLANLAGTATETVIRCLSEFKSMDLIEIQGREIIIKDMDALENLNI
jgi:DNA-binding response OmpR family regulator/predicted DNA-binding protein (UPF0251 family)